MREDGSRRSTIEDLAVPQDGFQEGIAHGQASLKLIGAIHQETHRDIPVDQAVEFSDALPAEVIGICSWGRWAGPPRPRLAAGRASYAGAISAESRYR